MKKSFLTGLFGYVLLCVVFVLLLCFLYKEVPSDDTSVIIWHLVADAMFFALPVLFWKKKAIVFPWVLLVMFYMLSIVWYARTYATLMPLSSYLMVYNLDGLGASVLHSIHPADVKFLLPPLIYFLFYGVAAHKGWLVSGSARKIAHRAVCPVLAWVIVVISFPYWPNKRPFYKQPLYVFSIVNTSAIKQYGVLNYWVYQIKSLKGVSSEESCYTRSFVEHLPGRHYVLPDSLSDRKPNLILILVESLQSWPIGLKVEDVEVTPCLNRLLADSTTVYFPNMVPQVKDGRSGDAQLLINTGLLPLRTGAVSSLYADNVFPSLASALRNRGYRAAESFICDCRTFWNQGATTLAYGFDCLHDDMGGTEGRSKMDEHLFAGALPRLRKMECPFYAQLVTLSMHEPYVEPVAIGTPLDSVACADPEVRNYLIAVNYTDSCIATFLENLKEAGLYDNSLIVITGDHEQMHFSHYEGRDVIQPEDYFIPFLVVNAPLSSSHTGKVVGQMDIYPSLLHLTGCGDYGWKGLGESLFADEVSGYATFNLGMEAGDREVPDSVKRYRQDCWRVSDLLIRMNYFKE